MKIIIAGGGIGGMLLRADADLLVGCEICRAYTQTAGFDPDALNWRPSLPVHA